jgi:hypothetical protein
MIETKIFMIVILILVMIFTIYLLIQTYIWEHKEKKIAIEYARNMYHLSINCWKADCWLFNKDEWDDTHFQINFKSYVMRKWMHIEVTKTREGQYKAKEMLK